MDLVKDNVVYMDESNLSILPEATVVEAAKKMRDKKLGALIVAGGGQNLGIITETDLSRKVVAEELNPKTTKVKFVMAKPIITIESSSSMMSAFLKMGSHQIRHVAVTEDDLVMGILSMQDFVSYYTKKFGGK
ncbi:MAG: CBS domain-containing protein [Nitrospinae bacterium]|nr:CBS domain-containing protein [Nitrospinota bacterium]